MRLRGHFIGALTLAFISLACASVNAKATDGAHAPATLIRTAPGAQRTRTEGFAMADQLLTELFDATAAGGATVNAMMEDPT